MQVVHMTLSRACVKYGQIPGDQTGEYPCLECGVPRVHDVVISCPRCSGINLWANGAGPDAGKYTCQNCREVF